MYNEAELGLEILSKFYNRQYVTKSNISKHTHHSTAFMNMWSFSAEREECLIAILPI